MPFADIEKRRKVARESYHRRVARDPSLKHKAAERMRLLRESMSSEENEAYLKAKREYGRRWRSDPKNREKDRQASSVRYRRDRQNPEAWARIQKAARSGYWKNQPWRLIQSAGLRAKKKGLAFDLDRSWLAENWTGRCQLTGISFIVGSKHISPFSPSIDRKDNLLGYTKDNCRFVLFGVNAAKNCGTDEDLLKIAKAIVAVSDSA